MKPEVLPDSAIRITSHELLALLSFNPGPGAELSRSVLVLADLPADNDLVRAGLTTLNVRDMAEIAGEEVNLLGGARVLSVILSTAAQWYEVSRFGAKSSLPSYLVSSPHGRAALFLRPLSEYVCLPLSADADLLDLVAQAVNGAVEEAQGMDGGLVVARQHLSGKDVVVANVKVNADGTRQLAALPMTDDGQLTVTAIPAGQSPGALVRGKFPSGS